MRLFRYAYRSADTGKYVPAEYARAHPKETVRERIWFWQKGL